MYQEIESTWTQDSEDYDEIIRDQLSDKKEVEHWMTELKSVLGEQPLHILDVGCGPGFLSILLARLGHHVKAIDGSQGMLQCAAANFQREGMEIPVQMEDAVKLPEERAESYDVILSRDVVWTLYDPSEAFARWKEVLKPEGRVIFYDGDYQRDLNFFKKFMWKALAQLLILVTERKVIRDGTDKEIFAELPMVQEKRPRKDQELLEKAGFCEICITDDRFRNSLRRMEYWKYGYQGKKFRVIACKESHK